MFLDEERQQLVVLAQVYAPYATPRPDASIDCLAYGGCGDWAVATKATVIDVSRPAAPAVLDEVWFPGWYTQARKVGRSIRLVLNDDFRWPEGIRWYPEGELDWSDEGAVRRARESLIPENERIIRAQPLSRWLPEGRRRLSDGRLVDVPYDCRDFNRVNASVSLGFTTVATLDLDALDRPSRTAVIAQTSEVYADLDTLYLATHHWWWWPAPGQTDYTYLVRLDTTDPTRARFVAAGAVEGHIVNQFSMDEYQDHLRVATTIMRRVPADDNPWGTIETTNRVTTLGVRGARLAITGQTPDLAPGERVQSARFIEDKGYVVTFEQIDPLFVIDLANPAAPRVLGELKIPGFSTYIHPLDAGHLLTIGIDLPNPVDGRVDWQERRMKLSIFDVRDPTRPLEKFTQTVGTAYGWSEAAWEHKAFNYFPERGVLAIPFSDYRPSATDPWGEFVSDLRVFRVDAATGIAPLGALSMADLYQTQQSRDWSWSWSPWIRRSVMADDFVYAISDAGVRAARIAAPSVPVATAPFDRVVRFGDCGRLHAPDPPRRPARRGDPPAAANRPPRRPARSLTPRARPRSPAARSPRRGRRATRRAPSRLAPRANTWGAGRSRSGPARQAPPRAAAPGAAARARRSGPARPPRPRRSRPRARTHRGRSAGRAARRWVSRRCSPGTTWPRSRATRPSRGAR
jgi:hypothetical protein